jgi:uncharacterized protein (DUF302 family)
MPDVKEVVTKVSPWSIDDTMARLVAVIRARGCKLFAVVDHSAEAAEVGVEVPFSKLVIFGNPETNAPVIASAPLVALDLPLKVLVWADRGSAMVSYTAPTALADRYRLNAELSERLAGIDSVTDAVIAL